MSNMTFDGLVKQYGAYSKDDVEYAITQNPYPDYVAGRSTGYVVSGETYFFAQGYDREGNPFRLIWEITNKDADDESNACDWDVFEAEPSSADLAPWHPISLYRMSNSVLFTQDNTSGYTDEELDALNREAETRVPELMAIYKFGIDEAEKAFSEEVARR